MRVGVGLQWSNIHLPVNPDDDLTALHMFIMFAVDTFLFVVIVWYVGHVHPGDYGVPKPYYFPFTAWYWRGGSRSLSSSDNVDSSLEFDRRDHEPLPPGAVIGIKVRHLRKVLHGVAIFFHKIHNRKHLI